MQQQRLSAILTSEQKTVRIDFYHVGEFCGARVDPSSSQIDNPGKMAYNKGVIWPQQLPPQSNLPPSQVGKSVDPIPRSRPVDDGEELTVPRHPPQRQESVGTWMQSVVATCGPEQTLGELTELLSLHQISGAPVVDDQGNLLGVVSQSDVAAYLGGLYGKEIRSASGFYQGLMGTFSSADPGVRSLLETKTVEELYTPHAHSIAPDADLDEVIDLMLREHVHRLPVVREGRLVGLVSTFDVLRAVRDRRQQQQPGVFQPAQSG